ncbi:MAG TPA: succinyl-diaminopimelate desuccinylase [Alphaproteobacteria bacterium]|nr:succinyl-diaminopimelate desuccinylase [Alphaproteobacteria bacterium]
MPATEVAGDPVALLKELIRRPSVTPAEAGVFDVLERALGPLGFIVTRVRFEGDGSYPVDNLFATRGSGGKHLLFAGHTDVVPPGDGWTHDPFAAEEAGGIVYGRGAADMKSGIAAFVAALARAGTTRGRVSLAITNDEEQEAINGTEKLLAWAAAQGHRFDFAIVGEPSATAVTGDSLKVGRRGSFSGRITVTGVQGHVAYPDRARNPLPVLAAAVTALKAQPLDGGTEHFPPSNLEFTSIDVGNEAGNVIPGRGTARFNIRFNDRWSPEALAEWVQARLADVDPNGCTITFEPAGRPSQVFLSPPGEGLDILVRTITAQRGRPPELATGGGTSDARFIAPYCPVVECGLPGPTMHKVDEQVRIADLEALTALYAGFLAAYLA